MEALYRSARVPRSPKNKGKYKVILRSCGPYRELLFQGSKMRINNNKKSPKAAAQTLLKLLGIDVSVSQIILVSN